MTGYCTQNATQRRKMIDAVQRSEAKAGVSQSLPSTAVNLAAVTAAR
jgi:hypothetical protein